ncbi:RNA polymerase sigma factor [Lachnoclostridium phytofermentans]|uniref:RNA polymerase, sigma-24 subunit, ECF subfamily n=1 Tax=Lachnoclostridium phytofermentans (strain ATCC 700394 / DSM 18823 / ISDg) TaxID=357809 RepID=A9KIT0_LACP7|nr:sigma-70 family RNA polymerase sigma factor [Lachnoclostridium phytofermentans]ABX43943.1 RNA polymerase, sigma-24 subunit, ECF subfamily [Lachnoclostridium phytofermentans ISDg]
MQTENDYEIEDLVRTYGNDVLRTAYMYVKDIHIAEDIFQDVFIKVNNHLHTFQGNSSIKTWILRITINTCKDYIKSAYHRKMVPMEEFIEDSIVSESEFDAVEREETIHTVKEAVMALPEHYRSVILCVYFDELSMDETAKALDLPVGTVKSRLARAKEKLKESMEGRI